MFGRPKTQTDVKKSTQKLLDTKKDVSARLKHLKIILENADGAEAKAIFSTHYSHIYHLVYEGIIAAEASLKLKGGIMSPSLSETLPFSLANSMGIPVVHRAQREELESVVHLLEKIIVLLPDLLHCRWQLHSLSRLMAKLNHPSNSIKLRREGMRLFLMWYQCLGSAAPNYIHSIYASLVPGLPGLSTESWPPPSDPSWGISPLEITAVIPASSSEKQPDDLTAYFLECLLDYMVSQAPKIHWKDGLQMWASSIDFLYERFKEFYLPRIFPYFEICTDIYKPSLDLPQLRRGSNENLNHTVHNCQVVFIKWVANYSHSVYRSSDCYHQPVWNAPASTAKTIVQNDDPDRSHSTPPSSLSGGDRDSIASYSSIPSDVDANVIGKDVVLGSRANINLVHEVFRRALLMNFVHSVAIRRVIGVYKDWIQINVPELPVFMLEPEDPEEDTKSHSSKVDSPKPRLRTDSYMGAIGFNANNNREEYLSHLRAGAQKVLRLFFCNSASVFLLVQQKSDLSSVAHIEEQVDICKRVLNIYRYTVMNTRMDPKTWEQLLVVMIHVTSTILDPNQSPRNVNRDSLGPKLAAALFQTLIVSWVKACLNVPISLELWDQLQSVLSQLTYLDDLITEWAKTMETLTRVLARHLYNLDLANLPLDKLSEQRAMKRALQSGTFVKGTVKQASAEAEGMTAFPRKRNASSGTTERSSLPFTPTTPIPQRRKLVIRRSLSEGNMLTPAREDHDSPDATVSKRIERANGDLEVVRKRKISRSFDSVRFQRDTASVSQYSNLQSEWAEISSSTASLENTHSSIHMDGESTNINVCPEKEEPLGVILGGAVKGWLPSVAGVLWRRMLGVLGSPNQFINPKTHFHFFQVLTEIWNTLFKLRLNQCISVDNTSTPKPSELVPPLTVIAPWCLEALELPEEYHKGKVLACSLLCEITLTNKDLSLSHEYLCKFYAAMHKQILISKQDVVNEIVRKCGQKFISKMLPGFSLLALDLIQASHSVLSSEELKSTPRTEAAALLGSVLAVADIFKEIPVLKPNSMQFHPIQSQQTKEIVISCLIMNAKKERTSQARAIILQSLTNYIAQQLMEVRLKNPTTCSNEFKKRLNDILSLLLESVKVENRSVALVASDLLLFLSEFAPEISSYIPEQCSRIILGLKLGLQQILPLKNSTKSSGKPPEIEKRLCVSLMLTLGEWCMNLPLQVLLMTSETHRNPLLSAVFEVYSMIARGYRDAQSTQIEWEAVEDFDPHIPFDDLRASDIPSWVGKDNTIINPEKMASQEAETIKLAARTMMLHLMTQLGHFPISSDVERCSSGVCENDDLSGISSELDEFSARVFTLPNLQMFTLDNETLVTMVELPVAMPDDSITSAFQTSHNQVRVIVRDLSGKACWDATHLVCVSNSNDQADSSVLVQPHFNEDLFYQSAITGSFFPPMGPRLTLRRRVAGTLPTVEDSADDLDNLDDLLNYIGHTSPECQLVIGESLTSPWGPPPSLSQEIEDDVVSAVVNQRNSEVEYLLKTDLDPLMRARPVTCSDWVMDDGDSENMNSESSFGISKLNSISSSFLLSRRIFSQLGFNGWDKRTTVNLLNKDEKLLREIKHLDSQKCREVHKIAVIYVAEGQDDKQSVLYNSGGSEAYEDFVAGLGWEVELETHTGFMGGLQRNKSTGETAPYYATSFTEVIYHVATRMPSNTEESLLQKTRHLGNDEVHIVWSEHKREYRRDIIPTEFCDVLIVIYPLQYGLFRVQITKKPEVPYFGPLFNGAIVEKDVLAPLVRATAINASRAKRCSLQFFQHHFQERAKSLSTIIQNHKIRSTFEQFTTNVFSPRLPPSFQPRATHRASATSFSSISHVSVPSAPPHQLQLASALLDHTASFNSGTNRSSNSPAPSITSTFHDVNLSTGQEVNQNQLTKDLNNHSPPQHLLVPPVPPKRLGAKISSALKPKLHTPPASPAFPRISPPRNHQGSNSNKH